MGEAFYRRRQCLGLDHPCLPGHFPGAPVVPGVLLLQWLAQAVLESRGLHLRRIEQVKYLKAWLPEREVELRLQQVGERIGFALWDGEQLLARGQAEAVA